MRCAGAYDDVVGWIEWTTRSVGMNDRDLRPRLERDPGAICEGFINFDGDYAAGRAHKFGEDSRVVASATTEMKDRIARLNIEQAQVKRPKAGLPVVQVLVRVKNNKRILVN